MSDYGLATQRHTVSFAKPKVKLTTQQRDALLRHAMFREEFGEATWVLPMPPVWEERAAEIVHQLREDGTLPMPPLWPDAETATKVVHQARKDGVLPMPSAWPEDDD
jgi:hypothetical protein